MKKIVILALFLLLLLIFSAGQTLVDDSLISQRVDEYFSLLANQKKFSGSLLITREGKDVIRKSYGMANYEYSIPNAPQTVFRIGSVSKQFTAFAIMQLEDKGLINTEDSIGEYIPDYPNGSKITIHHLLSHRSGIPREKTDAEKVVFLTARQTAEYEKDTAEALLF